MRGWTQYDLAAASGIAVHTVRGYEQRKAWPRANQLEALAKALETSPAALIAEHGERTTATPQDAVALLLRALNNQTTREAIEDAISVLVRMKK